MDLTIFLEKWADRSFCSACPDHSFLALFQNLILFVCHRFEPFIRGLFSWNFYCQMGKPTVLCRSMPVLNTSRNRYHVARMQFPGLPSPFLVPSPSGRAKKNLTSSSVRSVNMPIISALNWTPYSQSLVVTGFNGIHVCALCELFVTSSFARLFLCFVLVPNLFCKVEHCPAFWPACIECYVGDNRCDFFLRYPMILGIL